MFRHALSSVALASLTIFGCCVAASAQAGPATPAPSPSPSPVAKPSPAFTLSGTARAYAFDRINGTQNASNPNRTAFNLGGNVHVDYHVSDTPIGLGAAYYGAYPFGANGLKAQSNTRIDNTLPGFALSTVGQLYARYKSRGVSLTVGNQEINRSWAPTSDTRIKPALYQGADASVAIADGLVISADRMIRFEGRTASAFDRSTLLTSSPAGNPSYAAHETSGFLRLGTTWTPKQFVGNAEYYQFYQIANLLDLDGKYSFAPKTSLNPTFAAQFVSESQTGAAYVGRIENTTYGVQLGVTPVKNLSFAASYDQAPWNYADVFASSTAKAGAAYFLPGGGTSSVAAIGPGLYRVAYGGIASPYTEAYATDPLFTTSISQGMVDRHSAGTSYRGALTYLSTNKQLRLIGSEAIYDYGNSLGGNHTYELNADVTYDFNKVRTGTYKGFMIRERYANRTQPKLPYHFQYVRSQLEYDF